MNHTGKNYGDMTLEELQRELREAFLDTDILDEPLNDELEQIREAMNRKRPVEYLYTPEESWARFWEKNAEELETILRRETDPTSRRADAERPRSSNGSQVRASRPGRVLRGVLIAAVITVLLAGAALAANSRGCGPGPPNGTPQRDGMNLRQRRSPGTAPSPQPWRSWGSRSRCTPQSCRRDL